MIQFLVSAYRVFIVIGVLITLLAAAILIMTGGVGIFIAFGMVIASVFALGASAVLLSINDHVMAIAQGSRGEPDSIPAENRTAQITAAVVGFVLIAFLLGAVFAPWRASTGTNAGALPYTSTGTDNFSTVSNSTRDYGPGRTPPVVPNDVKNGCSPTFAREARLSCK